MDCDRNEECGRERKKTSPLSSQPTFQGFFLDYPSIGTNTAVYTEEIKVVYALSNASTNAACQAANKGADAYKCLMYVECDGTDRIGSDRIGSD